MKAVICFSGGIDSTTCLFHLMDQHEHEIYPVYFDYGQKQKDAELTSMYNIFDYIRLNIRNPLLNSLKVIKIQSDIFKTSMVREDMEIPTVTDDDHKEGDTTHVIMREVIFASLATAYADSIDASYVYMMNHASSDQNTANLHLTSEEAITALKQVVRIGTNKKIKLQLPFVYTKKKGILELAKELNVPVKLCWTCYNHGLGGIPCGKCKSCYERNKAFKELEVE